MKERERHKDEKCTDRVITIGGHSNKIAFS